MEDSYTIRAVERLTGVPQQLIRTWERRYGVVAPGRTATNRRRYSRRDVEKLRLVKAAIEAGNSIGAVAALDVDALRRMLPSVRRERPAQAEVSGLSASDTVRQGVELAQRLDAPSLQELLASAASELGPARFAAEVAAPLLHALGSSWRSGDLHPAQEHLASEVLRAQLARLIAANQPDGDAPVAVVATLRGHAHHLGAMLAAVAAVTAGWSVRYLGTSLPAEEIAWAARASDARAVLISIVYPPDDPGTGIELGELRRMLGAGFPIVAGGRAAKAYAAALEENDIVLCDDLACLQDFLDSVRR